MGIFHEEIKRLRAEAIRLRSYNEGLAKIAAQQDEQIERLRAALSDTVETLEAMDLHVDNPLYDRLRRALEQKAPREG